MSAQRYDASVMSWTQEEEIYLHSIQLSSEELSNTYLNTFRRLRNIQAKIKIPIIIVGSFTGITSFGTDTFPQKAQKWVSIGVGIISIVIAVLNTIESYFKIGENANAAINTTNALQQLREDINKELSLPAIDRQAPGLTFLRDCYTRYQQIISQAPILNDGGVFYVAALASSKLNSIIKKNEAQYIDPPTSANSPARKSYETGLSRFFGKRPSQENTNKSDNESGKFSIVNSRGPPTHSPFSNPPLVNPAILEHLTRHIVSPSSLLSKTITHESKEIQTIQEVVKDVKEVEVKGPASLTIELSSENITTSSLDKLVVAAEDIRGDKKDTSKPISTYVLQQEDFVSSDTDIDTGNTGSDKN